MGFQNRAGSRGRKERGKDGWNIRNWLKYDKYRFPAGRCAGSRAFLFFFPLLAPSRRGNAVLTSFLFFPRRSGISGEGEGEVGRWKVEGGTDEG